MNLKYTEGSACVLVPGVGPVKRGETADIKDSEQAKQLLAQGWVEARSKTTAPDAGKKES